MARPALPQQLATQFRGFYLLLLDKYRIDELYDAVLVRPLVRFSRYVLSGFVDGGLITGTGFGLGAGIRGLGSVAQRMQSGNIRSYAGWLAFGAAVLLLLTFFGFGDRMVLPR